MQHDSGIERLKRVGTALAFIVFPPMLLVGFLLHPDITSLELVTDAEEWAAEFRGNFLFHFGHLIVMFVAPLAIIVGTRCMRFSTGEGAWMIFWGGVMGVFGAFILAVDKGALTLVLTAFDTHSDSAFEASYPVLQVMLDRGGWLWIVNLLALLPLGFIVQALGLARAGVIGKGRAALIVIGMATLFVGDIEIITVVGALLLCFGYMPMGLREFRGELRAAS